MKAASFGVATKLWALFCVLIAVSIGRSGTLTYLLTLFAFFQLALQKKWKLIFSYGIFYVGLGILMYGIRYHGWKMMLFSEFYVLMFWVLSPIFLVSWDLMTTPPGKLSAFLSRWHTPTPVILGLLVVFRFFPTMKAELHSVYLSMKNRGLTSLDHILRHPVVTCEYVLIPFLLRILLIADQLAVSAVARGAEHPGVRGSYYGKEINMTDGLMIFSWTAGIIVFLAGGGLRI